jgi:hypothetical protein
MSWTRVNLPYRDEAFVRCLSSRCENGPVGVFGAIPTSPHSVRVRMRRFHFPRSPSFFMRRPTDHKMISCFEPVLLPFPHAKGKKMVYVAEKFPWFDQDCGSSFIHMYMTWRSMDAFQRACVLSRDEADVQRVMEM